MAAQERCRRAAVSSHAVARRAGPVAVRAAGAAVSVLLVAGTLRADVTPVHWLNPVDGDWSVASNWSGGVAPNNGSPTPTSSYDVTLDALGTDYYRVYVQSDVAVDKLTLDSPNVVVLHSSGHMTGGEELNILQGRYVLNGSVPQDASYGIFDTRIAVSDTGEFFISSNGSGRLSNVTLAGKLHSDAAARIENGLTLDNGTIELTKSAALEVYGAQTIGGTGQIVLQGGTAFTVPLIRGYNAEPWVIGSGVTIRTDNSTGLITGLYAPFENQGTILHNGEWLTLTLGGTWSNSGLLKTTAGTLRLTGNWSSSGTIECAGGTIEMDGTWSNNGTITLNGGQIDLGGTFNFGDVGTIERTSGTIRIVGNMDNAGRTLDLNATGPITLDLSASGTGSITGGTVHGTGSNTLTAMYGTIDGVSLDANLNIANGARVHMHNPQPLVSGHTITLNTPAGTSDYTILYYGPDSTITGPGQITLTGNNVAATWIQQESGALTVAPETTIGGTSGRSTLGLDTGTFTNKGLIWADGSNTFVTTTGTSVVNQGTMEARNSARFRVGGTWANQGILSANGGILELGGSFKTADIGVIQRTSDGIVRLAGDLDNTNAVFTLDDSTGSLDMINPARITGGIVRAAGAQALAVPFLNGAESAVLADTSLEVNVSVAGASELDLAGTVSLIDHTISLVSDAVNPAKLMFSGDAALQGAGSAQVVFNGTASDLLYASVGQTTLGPNLLVRTGTAGGQIVAQHNGTIVNRGTISAQTPGKTIQINARDGFINEGLLEATNGGTLMLAENLVDSSGAISVTNGGTLIVDGSSGVQVNATDMTNNANGVIKGNGTIGVQGTDLANDGTIAPGMSAGTLRLTGDYSQSSSGRLLIEVAGLNPGSQYDRFLIGGSATLSGKVQVLLLGSPQLPLRSTFDVLTADSILTHSLVLDAPTLGSGATFGWSVVNVAGGQESLRLTVVPEPTCAALLAVTLPLLAMRRRRRPSALP